jgi:DNA-binding GntR family transcriptional regulator
LITTPKRSSLPIAAIDQNGLSQQVYARLKSAILQGSFAQGERLSTDELARHFAVSMMPVRDALRMLAADGLVQIMPRRGVFVSEVKIETVHEIFHIRKIIERGAVENLASASSTQIETLQATFSQMEALRRGEAYPEYSNFVQLDAHFHNLIVAIAGNHQLLQIYEGLHWPIQLVLVLAKAKSQRGQETALEHAAIVAAIVARDVQLAQQALTSHLVNAEIDLLRRLPPEATKGGVTEDAGTEG